MAKARSPEYPAIGLREAIGKVRMVYSRDYQNRIPREVLAAHMGYKSLSGASLPVLSALNKYGLIEGRGNETRVSDLAVAIIAHEPGAAERVLAIREAAAKPELFAELDKRYPNGKTSDAAIRAHLLTQKFIPAAADAAIRAYRETKELVEGEPEGYISRDDTSAPAGGAERKNDLPERRPPPSKMGLALMEGERVVFTEESDPQRYVKLIASGEVDETLLDALSDYVKRQRRRLNLPDEKPKREAG